MNKQSIEGFGGKVREYKNVIVEYVSFASN